MEFYKKYPLEYDRNVCEIQTQLNSALRNAYQLVECDSKYRNLFISDCHYFEKIHHLEYVPSSWRYIVVDGYFGDDTENAVKAFQQFLYITVNGRVGEYTKKFLCTIANLKISIPSVITPQSTTNKVPQVLHKVNHAAAKIFAEFISGVVFRWNEVGTPIQGILFFLGNGFIVLSERTSSSLYLHLDLKRIVDSLLFPEHTRPGKWIRVNHNNRFRQFTAFNVSRTYCKISQPIQNLGAKIGVAACVVETLDVVGKSLRKELKFTDIAKLGLDTISTGFDYMLRDVNTVRMPIQKASVNLGKRLLDYKFATKVLGKAATSAGAAAAAGTVVVFVQCAGAFMLGVEIGNWLESRTHWGEKGVNWAWDLFIGDLVARACEWNANRVVCVKYPEDWTEQQIEEFQKRFQ